MAAGGQVAKSALASQWLKKLKECLDFDSWGQREEAREGYTKLAKRMVDELSSTASEAWSDQEVDSVQNLAICLRLRAYGIQKLESDGITIENIKALVPVAETLFRKHKKFPLDLSSADSVDLAKAMSDMVIRERGQVPTAAVEEEEEIGHGPGPPALRHTPSGRAVSVPAAPAQTPLKKGKTVAVTIEKMGFKDENASFVDAIITVFVVSAGKVLGVTQDTHPYKDHRQKYFHWDETITLMQTLDLILPGSAIVFEFRHYKREKNKMSTKCWAFLDREDLKEGSHVLELYKKPTDLKRKKLSLLTVKPLYLHINIDISPS